jgi:two-component system, NtrC family, response regulator GlrR
MKVSTRLLEVKDARTLTMPGARLVVQRGPDRGRAVRLEREETVVGTGPSADLILSDGTVSRSHLLLRVTEQGYLAQDLGSTNGTLLDGRRIGSVFIEVGDKLDLGGTRIRLEAQREAIDFSLSPRKSFGRLIGSSVAARRLFALLEQIAESDATVLLTGETGTGKDLSAEALHGASRRADGPFVVFDCSAVVGALLDSELFGHEQGAFTGADRKRLGAVDEAHGGTLFLDEVGELPRALQPKLLGVLERREVRPVGANAAHPVDVRIIAATNRDLKLDVNRGLFREDLFHRLNVVHVRVPPLRERVEDIPLLAEAFWREVTGDAQATLPSGLSTTLVAQHWPGNVRELRNRVEQAALLERFGLERSDEGAAIRHYRSAKAAAIEAFERAFFTELLARAEGNVSEAARLASMDRVYLTKLLRRYRLSATVKSGR